MAIKECPLISLVIPMRNEAYHIAKCLESIISQDYPIEKMEIIVVDGNSDDDSLAIARKYANQYKFIKLFNNPKKITPVSMNIGINKSMGEIIIILSAHSYIAQDFVSTSVNYLNETGADCVGGAIELLNSSNTYVGRMISYALVSPFGVANSLFRYSNNEQYVDTVFNGAYKREVFNKIGLFDETLVRNQDIELNSRIRMNGGKIFYTPKIKSFPYTRPSIDKMIKQNFGNGLWNIMTFLKNPRALSLRHFVPMLFVFSLLLCLIMSPFIVRSWYLFWAILIAYFSMAILFSFPIVFRRGFVYLFGLPFVFFLFHFSYGLGSLFGLFNEIIRKNGYKMK